MRGVTGIKTAAMDVVNNPTKQNYNCFRYAVDIAMGNAPTQTNLMPGGYRKEIDESFYRIKKSERRLGDVFSMSSEGDNEHAANYICTSKSGESFFWSKNGKTESPKVQTQTQLGKIYHRTFSTDYHKYFRSRE
jgi:hypothetical protein